MTTKPKLELRRPRGAPNAIEALLALPTSFRRRSARYRPLAR